MLSETKVDSLFHFSEIINLLKLFSLCIKADKNKNILNHQPFKAMPSIVNKIEKELESVCVSVYVIDIEISIDFPSLWS